MTTPKTTFSEAFLLCAPRGGVCPCKADRFWECSWVLGKRIEPTATAGNKTGEKKPGRPKVNEHTFKPARTIE